MEHQHIQDLLDGHALTVESVFIPFSQSRNKAQKEPSLNWSITLRKCGREIVACEYSAGNGHCPFRKSLKWSKLGAYERDQVIAAECESGFNRGWVDSYSGVTFARNGASGKRIPIKPNTLDVVYSLLSDASVLDSASFEEWAGEYGYDSDSISDSTKAKNVYDACMRIAVRMRSGLGDSVMVKLREAFQVY